MVTAIRAFQSLLIIPIVSFPVIYLIARITKRITQKAGKAYNPAQILSLIAIAMLFYPAMIVFQHVQTVSAIYFTVGQITMQMNAASVFLVMVVVPITFLVVLFSGRYMKDEIGEEKYYAFLVYMIGMIVGVSTATDLFNLWVWFEAFAITPYVLVSFYHDRAEVLEAGVKYLLQSAVGTLFVLSGIIILYMHTGTLNLLQLRAMEITSEPEIILSATFFVIGFGVKSALVPLHTWLPDAHSQAPSGISAILSGIVIETALLTMTRILSVVNIAFGSLGTILIASGLLNMIIGNLMALKQNNIKRMLAFSSISHMGYITFGIGISEISGSPLGLQGSLFHILTHALMKSLAFMIIGALMMGFEEIKGDAHAPLVKDDLNGLSEHHRGLAFFLSIALLSLAGIPPLGGFMSKSMILYAGVLTGNLWIIGGVIFAAINSVISLGYYAPLINRMYRIHTKPYSQNFLSPTNSMVFVFLILTVCLIVLGFFPGLFGDFNLSANYLLSGLQ
jgi:proton-translocating NADH-quinone oxidoreductase chain N